MNMLTKEDLEQIGGLIDAKLDTKIGEVLEVVNEGFSEVQGHFEKIGGRLDKIEFRLDTEMVTKSYLDEKLADLRGDLIANDRKLEYRLDRHLDGAGREELESLRLFPRSDSPPPTR